MPECEGNPAKLDCPSCKSFKAYGICSHVLAVNHILTKFNVRYRLAELSKTKSNNPQGSGVYGRRALSKTAPALEKQRLPFEEDSSDDEESVLRRLGLEGR